MPAVGILVDGMPVGSAHIVQTVDSQYADGPLSGGITAGGLTFPGIGRQDVGRLGPLAREERKRDHHDR